jgi:hypothetical protein
VLSKKNFVELGAPSFILSLKSVAPDLGYFAATAEAVPFPV